MCRFHLLRSTSVQLLATLTFYFVLGTFYVIGLSALCGLFGALVVVEGPQQRVLRVMLMHAVTIQLTELLYVRMVVTPFFQHFACGPVLLAISVWYLSIVVVKGALRILILLFFVGSSFFNPQACVFPNGYEIYDAAHVTFMNYVAQRVEYDKVAGRNWDAALSLQKLAAARKRVREGMRHEAVNERAHGLDVVEFI